MCKFVTKIYRRIVFKNITDWRSVFKAALVTFLLCVMSLFQSTESMALGKSVFLWGRLTSGHWFCTHSLKSFWSCDNAEWTSPFWARAGSGRIRLSRTFRGPFANLSRISRLKNEISETNVYARVSFIIYANHAGCHCQLSEHGTIRNMNPVAILQGKLPNMNTLQLSIPSIFINSGIQTFRKPYAALSRLFATAAKHTHPYLQVSLGY